MIQDNPAYFFLLISILIVALVVVIYLVFTRKSSPALSRQKYQTKWLEIENSIGRDNLASQHMAILNADKLLDKALQERRFKGKTMGERMKSANKLWHNPNHVWGAHKIRNQLAHEADTVVAYDTVRRALSAYKQALIDLGAI